MPKNTKKIVFYSAIVSAIMFAFTFAMVPLYSAFCKVTGLNTAKLENDENIVLDKDVTIQFVATNNSNLPWDFFPKQKSIDIHPEQNAKIYFHAKNNSDHTMTIQAIPSFSPGQAVRYFHKIECFCFKTQTLKAGESKDMLLIFRIDKYIPTELNTITLSYTLFDITGKVKT